MLYRLMLRVCSMGSWTYWEVRCLDLSSHMRQNYLMPERGRRSEEVTCLVSLYSNRSVMEVAVEGVICMLTTPIDPLEMIWITLFKSMEREIDPRTHTGSASFEQGQLIADGQCEDNATSEL